MFCACNDEWKDEQFAHYISFKAPINDNGVTLIYVPQTETGKTTYRLPVLVSGSTLNDRDVTVKIGIDPDTLRTLNIARFASRTDLWYKELPQKHYSFPETVQIKAGENIAYLDIEFDLNDLDLVDKWVLPLTIMDDPNGQYTPNYRKNYRKALLRVMPFNYYSGPYGTSTLIGEMTDAGDAQDEPLVKSTSKAYPVDNDAIFLYAGTIDEKRQDRAKYKIEYRFIPSTDPLDPDKEEPGTVEKGTVELKNLGDPKNNFNSTGNAVYTVKEVMDATRPYLKHRTITIRNIEYTFTDFTMAEGTDINFKFKGTVAMQRDINTQIPDEDQAIEW